MCFALEGLRFAIRFSIILVHSYYWFPISRVQQLLLDRCRQRHQQTPTAKSLLARRIMNNDMNSNSGTYYDLSTGTVIMELREHANHTYPWNMILAINVIIALK